MVKITKLLEICKLLKIYHAQCREGIRPVKNCITTTSETICSPTESKCLTELLTNNTAASDTVSSYDFPAVTKIDNGVIILNDVSVISDGHNNTLSGTLVIMFDKAISINESTFNVTKNITFPEVQPPNALQIGS